MTEHPDNYPIARLAPYIGEWRMRAMFPEALPIQAAETQGGAWTVFEWLSGRRFVVQRWEVPDPAAPDGIAIVGWNGGKGTYVQHYFDSRGVARLYEMSFAAGVWSCRAPPPISRRLISRSAAQGRSATTAGPSAEAGSPRSTARWEHDFELIYTKVS